MRIWPDNTKKAYQLEHFAENLTGWNLTECFWRTANEIENSKPSQNDHPAGRTPWKTVEGRVTNHI